MMEVEVVENNSRPSLLTSTKSLLKPLQLHSPPLSVVQSSSNREWFSTSLICTWSTGTDPCTSSKLSLLCSQFFTPRNLKNYTQHEPIFFQIEPLRPHVCSIWNARPGADAISTVWKAGRRYSVKKWNHQLHQPCWRKMVEARLCLGFS